MRGGEWIGRVGMVLLVFLSRLYTKGQELECDGGVHGCCVNMECNEDSLVAKPRHIKPQLVCRRTNKLNIYFAKTQLRECTSKS